MSFIVYMLICSDDYFYIGLTSDLSKRLIAHESGIDPKSYTSSRPPVKLVWAQDFPTHEEAIAFERQIKGWSRVKKKVLIEDDWDRSIKLLKRNVKDEKIRSVKQITN